MITALAVFSGALQVFGYWLYQQLSLRQEIDPNPATWFMCAYGTALVALLEWDLGASWTVLFLPVLCAVCSIYIAYLAWQRSGRLLPDHWADWMALFVDVGLTIGYVTAAVLVSFNMLSSEEKGTAILAFLILSNATTIPTYAPMIRDLWSNPHHENHWPWLTWSAAYAILAIITWYEHKLSELMIYPVINLALCLLIFWLVRPSRRIAC